MPLSPLRITPCLWYDDKAEAAAELYTTVFPNSKVLSISRYTAEGQDIHGKSPGSVMTVAFELDGQPFVALNGGPQFTFDEAISFQVLCETQDELDYYWSRLSEGGSEGPCGWLKDRFGLSWQVTPRMLMETVESGDEEKSSRALKALYQMSKIDIATIERAIA